MTGYSVTFRQEPKHELTGAWFDAPLLVISEAQASGPCQTSQNSQFLMEEQWEPPRPAPSRAGRQRSIPFSAHFLCGKLGGKMKADQCGQEISRQPLKRAFATSGPAFTSVGRWVNGQQQTWQVAWDQSGSYWDWISFCFPLMIRMPIPANL